MPLILKSFGTVLTSGPMAILAELAAAALLIALLATHFQLSESRKELKTAQDEVTSLKAAVGEQNDRIKLFSDAAAAAQKRATAAQEDAWRAKMSTEQSITALLNRPYAKTLDAACKAANDLLLEYAK